MSSVWVIACTVEVNGPGLLTDHHVLFQSGMLTFQITSPSTQWAPRRRTRTLMTGQKVRRDKIKKTSNRAALLMNDERCLLEHSHTCSGLCWITSRNWFSCNSCLAVEHVRLPKNANRQSPVNFRQLEENFLILGWCTDEILTVHFKKTLQVCKILPPLCIFTILSVASCYLEVDGSHVASWGMKRINLCLLCWPEWEATLRFVQLSWTNSSFILCVMWYYWNLSALL